MLAPQGNLVDGTPCWIELSTPDLDGAREFYTGLFGWECVPGEQNGHLIAYRDGYPVAGLRARAGGTPTWRLYLAAQDSAAVALRGERLGARVLLDREWVPELGGRVVLESPAGDEFGLLDTSGPLRGDVGLPGTLTWAELVTIKAQRADLFYQGLFGYEGEQFGTAHRSDYSVWFLGGDSVLARVSMIRKYVTPETRPHWLLYLGADPGIGTDATVHEAIARGGRVRVDPYETSLGRVAVLRDPTGARFALVDSASTVLTSPGTGNDDPYDD